MTTENTDVDRLAAYGRPDEVTSAQQKTATANTREGGLRAKSTVARLAE
ncbi:hypothetical protein [Dickeya zeae]|nr:hypothetical protein [Dickeya zeae]UJR59166.1 hypothetical protein HJ580_13865 [Dickeya zeae]